MDLSSLEFVLNGSEPILQKTLDKFYDAFKECGFQKKALIPCYGLAEATLLVSISKKNNCNVLYVSEKDLKENKITLLEPFASDSKPIVSCGTPYQEVQIVNPNTRCLCHENEIGEVWINSESVADGYWRQKELSQTIFNARIKNNNTHDTHYLRSGDLGFMHKNDLYIMGRIKDLIIIHGVNYYPQDIEDTVSTSHKKIRVGNCAAFSISGDNSEQLVIVAEILSSATQHEYLEICNTISEAVNHLHNIRISEIVLIPARTIPKTTSGKIRRQICRQQLLNGDLPIYYKSVINSCGLSIPINQDVPLQEWIIQWITVNAQLPNHFTIDCHKPLTSFCLDSLLIVQLHADLEKFLNCSIDPDIFWQANHIEDLVSHLQNHSFINLLPKPETQSGETLTLSVQERSLWDLLLKNPSHPAYVITGVFEIHAPFHLTSLKNTFQTLLTQETIFRTCYKNNTNQIYREIENINPENISFINLQTTNIEQQENEITKYASYLENSLFLVNPTKLWYFQILQLSPTRWLFMLAIHHLIIDGWSLIILLENFLNIYWKILNNKIDENKKAKILSYSDYASWQNKLIEKNILSKQENFWENEIKHWQEPKLFYKKQKILSNKATSYHAVITNNIIQQLSLKSTTTGITLFSYVFTAWQFTLRDCFPNNNVSIKLLSANRHHPFTQKIMGFFANGLLFCYQYDSEDTIQIMAQKTHNKLNLIRQYNDFPYQLLEYYKKNYLSINKLCFNWHVYPSLNISPEIKVIPRKDLIVQNYLWDDGTEIAINCFPNKQNISFSLRYLSDYFDENYIQNLADSFLSHVYALSAE